MKKIILDTNFLIRLCKFKVGLEEIDEVVDEPYCLFTLDSVVDELEKISGSSARDSIYAKLALEMLKLNKIKILISGKTNTDKAIINLADKDTIVATNDIELREKLKKLETKTIYLRAKKHLGIN
jgi:rRNA-processing protein FCF1